MLNNNLSPIVNPTEVLGILNKFFCKSFPSKRLNIEDLYVKDPQKGHEISLSQNMITNFNSKSNAR